MFSTAMALVATVLVASLPTVSSMSIQESHCVIVVEGQKATGELVMSDPVCFESFSEALEAATGHAIPPDTVGGDVFTDSVIGQMAGSYTIGIHYSGYNGSGSSISVVGSSCIGGWWNTPSAWDNQISSSYNGCAVLRYYDYPNASGYLGYTSGVGTTDNLTAGANNKTESVKYSSS
jgi:hypothetical protein